MMNADFNNTEWHFTPGLLYYQYDDISMELGLIAPYQSEWKSDTRFPLVLYISETAAHKQELYRNILQYTKLAEQGTVVAIAQIRESGTAPFPAQIEDIHRAAAWLIHHAAQFHINKNQIFLAGNFSGGYLALVSAFTKAHGKYIPAGLPDYPIAGVIAYTASNAAACIDYVTADIDLPPIFLFCHCNDLTTIDRQTDALYKSLVDAGHKAERHIYGYGLFPTQTSHIVNVLQNFIFNTITHTLAKQSDDIMDITPTERILLGLIRKRPGMYIGELSLSKLRSFLDGYQHALLTHELDSQCCIIPRKFDDFVLKKYGLYPSCMGYVLAILRHVPEGAEAIDTFFRLLDEFLEIHGFEKIQ